MSGEIKNKYIMSIVAILFIMVSFVVANQEESEKQKSEVKKPIQSFLSPVVITEFRQKVLETKDDQVRLGYVVYLKGNDKDNKTVATFLWYDEYENVIVTDVADTILVPSYTIVRIFGDAIVDTTIANKIVWMGVRIYYLECERKEK